MAGLDDWYKLQASPTLGNNTALRSGPGSPAMNGYMSNRNSMRQDYARAARLLRREARRGNIQAAVALPNLRQAANDQGFTPGGIQRSEVNKAGDMNNYNSLVAENARADANTGRIQTAIDSPATGIASPLTAAPAQATTQLGGFAQRALGKYVTNAQPIDRADGNAIFRQGLDRALGQARTPDEVNELRSAGTSAGISEDAFTRRSNWWDKRRKIGQPSSTIR